MTQDITPEDSEAPVFLDPRTPAPTEDPLAASEDFRAEALALVADARILTADQMTALGGTP
jgi:hypothetical protein